MKRLSVPTSISRRLLPLVAAIAASASLWSGAPAASAQAAKNDVTIQLTARKVVSSAQGKEKLTAADQAKPGDVLEYSAVYRNTSKRAVSNLLATVPLPAGLEFLSGSTKPAQVQASVDGQSFASVPLRNKGVDADKDGQDDLVPTNAYRSVRWMVPTLAAGASVTVSVRARVVTTAATDLLTQKTP